MVATTERPRTRAKKTGKNRIVDGKAAIYPHFIFPQDLYEAANEKAKAEGLRIGDVLREGVIEYGQGATAAARAFTGKIPPLPRLGVYGLKRVWESGDQQRINSYMARLYEQGWPLRSIADGMVATGLVDSFTRQAVSLRVNKAPATLPDGLPDVPETGPRRYETLPDDGGHDLSFRVSAEDYDLANRRATYEAAMMTSVLEDLLRRYVAGTFEVVIPSSGPADN